MDLVPLFKSHYSLGKSVLTYRAEGSSKDNEPDSIVDIAKKLEIQKVFSVEDGMSGFLEAYSNLKNAKIGLHYGLRITVCNDMTDKTPDSLTKACKFVIFAKNTKGYRLLIKLYSIAAKEGFYYQPRLDYKTIKSLWSKKDLKLCVPFYDSFLYYNTLTSSLCVPDTNSIPLTFFTEDNNLPFDHILKAKVEKFAEGKGEIVRTQSIYYKNKSDFKTYLTFRCINKRTTLSKPNLDHMCSDQFSVESFNEKIQNK
ncbi:MAG TPA: hypothetical protein DEG69_12680 [Flavobacteriaceae bacterium]|nr:hypothetical protein [Flavobacteriaceae bacterium]